MTVDFDVDRFHDAVGENAEQHEASMRTLGSDIRELHAETRKAVGGTSRRDLLIRSALATTAITFGSQVIPMRSLFTGVATAQALTDADIAAFAASLEYTVVEIYAAAAATGKMTTPAISGAAASFATQHKAHGDAFAAASADKITPGTTNKTLMTALSTQLSLAGAEMDIVKLAFQIENAAAATYQFTLGALEDVKYQQLTASIMPIEAGHAAMLGQILFSGDPKQDKEDTWLPPFQTEAGFVDPTKNPLA
jgi:hypothetical protein